MVFTFPPDYALNLQEKIGTALASGVAIFLAGWLASRMIDGTGLKILLVLMAASAVILFAMPHSPVARPWPLVGGHFISAVIGVSCAKWIPQLSLAAALIPVHDRTPFKD
jgi:CBS domain-containing membrane protein